MSDAEMIEWKRQAIADGDEIRRRQDAAGVPMVDVLAEAERRYPKEPLGKFDTSHFECAAFTAGAQWQAMKQRG